MSKRFVATIIIICILFVGVISIRRMFFSNEKYIYVKIKMGQGYWWASTLKPPIWFVEHINKGEIERDLLGKPVAEIVSVRSYPWSNFQNQIDIFITLKLKVASFSKKGTYNFQRSDIAVGGPIDLAFSSTQISGTIIDISPLPFQDNYVKKTVYLTKRNAYPWEYNAISVGDIFNDGENDVFEIINKDSYDTVSSVPDSYGNFSLNTTDQQKFITLKTHMIVKKSKNSLIFGEEQIVVPGKEMVIQTPHLFLNNYVISKIE